MRQGGRFDGVLGVLGGLEVLRALESAGHITRHPIEVIDWTNEEGVRFEPAMMGSGVVYGASSVTGPTTAPTGERPLRRCADAIGERGDIANRPAPGAAYLELHIEQGPGMDDAGVAVGVVEGILGITWIDVVIEGQADHAGPSPMALRHDALAAAAEMITMVEALAIESAAGGGHVGRLRRAGLINVVPGKVVMCVDLRHMGMRASTRCSEIHGAGARDRAARGVEIAIDGLTMPRRDSTRRGRGDAGRPGRTRCELWSGAGHDAKYAADAGRPGMILCHRGGLSHCERSCARRRHRRGVATLLQTVLALDEAP